MKTKENNSFKPKDVVKVRRTLKAKWQLFRMDLYDGLYPYDDIQSAKTSSFLSEFDCLFQIENGKRFFENSLKAILSENIFIRGAVLKENEDKPNCERFIPKAEYMKEDRRFSPKDKEWLYLALGYPNNVSGRLNAIRCSQKECRAKVGERFAICQFRIIGNDERIVDLTIGDEWSPKCQKMIFREVVRNQSKKGYLNADEIINSDEYKRSIVAAYAQILSEELFVRLRNNNNKHYEYIPFHCIAEYFQSYGYKGIVYKSTVCAGGKNLVLFDKSLARPISSSITEYRVK